MDTRLQQHARPVLGELGDVDLALLVSDGRLVATGLLSLALLGPLLLLVAAIVVLVGVPVSFVLFHKFFLNSNFN